MDEAASTTSLTTIDSTPVIKLHESQKDGGLQIVNMVKNKVHILYDNGDKSLLARQKWHISSGAKTSALGRCAGYAMETLHHQFENRVVFHCCNHMRRRVGLMHAYHDCHKAIEYYENPNPNGIKKNAWYFSK